MRAGMSAASGSGDSPILFARLLGRANWLLFHANPASRLAASPLKFVSSHM
jgi:hypothetical protein